jgi:hypothetical protein
VQVLPFPSEGGGDGGAIYRGLPQLLRLGWDFFFGNMENSPLLRRQVIGNQ